MLPLRKALVLVVVHGMRAVIVWHDPGGQVKSSTTGAHPCVVPSRQGTQLYICAWYNSSKTCQEGDVTKEYNHDPETHVRLPA
jgi:hypothetical protein